MKIDVCLMSCNDNYKYYSFYHYVRLFWEKIGVKCILIFVGENLPDMLKIYSNEIIIFKPIKNMDSAFVAQNIRLLYPALLNCSNGVIISDIDIIPFSKKFFLEQIETFQNDIFINYTYDENICEGIKEYFMCYNTATPLIWSKIFNISNESDVRNLLIDWYGKINYVYDDKYRSKCKGFHNDQLMLYKYVNTYKENNIDKIMLIKKNTKRLEMKKTINYNDIKVIAEDIKNEKFDDFHIPKEKFNKDNLIRILNCI